MATALLQLSYKDGMTRLKLVQSPVLLALAAKEAPNTTEAEHARLVERMIRRHVNSILNLQDRTLLIAGLNLEQEAAKSFESRINEACIVSIGQDSAYYLEPETALGRFRYQLTLDLALRLLGGSPTYAMPRPPLDELELAGRLRRSHQVHSAIDVLKRLTESDDQTDRRHAWRLLATIAYESGSFDEAEFAFDKALQNAVGMKRGGKLSVAIDRYARLLTDEEEYERALAIVERALKVTIGSLWLWRRYGCVKWYAGDLLGAYAALTTAQSHGYALSRLQHARGQVLAELGRYEEAIDELTQALMFPRSPVSRAQAFGARAFALGMSGPLERALEEFREAEQVIPHSNWLHYWRGLCFLRHDKPAEAAKNLVISLRPGTARLNKVKREHAQVLLSEMEGGR